ncbi:MAG: YbjN domain-containing protein [Gemmatimonadota bacterium]
MVTRDDVESFLIRMDLGHEEIAEGMFLVRARQDDFPIVVNHSPPLLILRMKVMDLPEGLSDLDLAPLFRTLLEWNSSEVVHGAYGIEEAGELVLTHTLQLETLDFQELQASLESLQMAASAHLDRIRQLASPHGEEVEA